MASGSGSSTKEFVVRAPKDSKMAFGIVKFNPSNKVDFTKAESIRIERENNLKDFKAAYGMDTMPEFGAGSEFGRKDREEARRKKYGIHRRRYNVDDQPWLLKMGPGKAARRFKGTKEGGILENASYYIFTQCPDGAFDAYPVKDWHSFNPIIKYKHLNIDEAEEQFIRRDKTMNYFNIMVKKRMQGPDAEDKDKDDTEKKQDKKKKKKGKDFLLTDMDDWVDASEDDNEDSDDEQRKSDSDDSSAAKKKGKDKKKKTKKDHKTNSGDEAVEESDDGDEGREVDYMTDTDSDDEDMYAEKGRNTLDKYKQTGVEDEEGLQAVIESDEEEAPKDGSGNESSGGEGKGSPRSSDSSSDSGSDPEKDNSFVSPLFMQKKEASLEQKDRKEKDKDKKKSKKDKKSKDKKGKKRRNSQSSEASNAVSRSATPTSSQVFGEKKEESQLAKRAKMDTPPISGCDGLTEDMVRRYLMRKPMTTGELVKKFKNVGLTKDKLVMTITEILKRLNPEKKTIDGKLQLWIKKTE